MLLIEGEAGIGKTTLVERFLALHPRPGCCARAATSPSPASASPSSISSCARPAPARSTCSAASEHLTVGLELLERLGAADPRRNVVVVDDAHLADADSLRALLFCARRLTESATLFVLVVRGSAAEALPEGWLKLADETRHAARPLTADDARAFGEELGVPLTVDAAERLVEHTGGNPLHLRAVLRELPATGSWLHDDRPLPVPRHTRS